MPGSAADQRRLVAGDDRIGLGLRTAAQQDGGVVVAGLLERGLEACAHRQHRHQHADHAGDADDDHATKRPSAAAGWRCRCAWPPVPRARCGCSSQPHDRDASTPTSGQHAHADGRSMIQRIPTSSHESRHQTARRSTQRSPNPAILLHAVRSLAAGQCVDDLQAHRAQSPAARPPPGRCPPSAPAPAARSPIGMLPSRQCIRRSARRAPARSRPPGPCRSPRPAPPAAPIRPAPAPARVPLVKPSVFSTASSGMRSRTACAMVLPVSSSRVKNTAPMIAVTIRPMSANCLSEGLVERLLGLRLGFAVGVLRDRIDGLGHARGVVHVVQLDHVPADLAVDVLVGFVEVLPVEQQLVLLALASCRRPRLKVPRSVSGQALLPSFCGKMVACSGMVSPTFQPKLLGQRLADDGAGAVVLPGLQLRGGIDDVLRIQRRGSCR